MSIHTVNHPQAAPMALPGIRQVSFQQMLQWLRAGTRDMVKAWPVMLLWGALIAGLIAVGMATNFIAMVVVFPWLGHASWHVYRDLVEPA